MEKFTVKNGKKLRFGYTTGSCATAAAAAAAEMLFTGQKIEQAQITLPSGETAVFEIRNTEIEKDFAVCSVTKDGGDDPDATHGAEIFAKVSRELNSAHEGEILLKGGKGVGTVTANGLQCPVGQPAINPVPQKMIRENTGRIMGQHGYTGGLTVEISVPTGEEIAKHTYNPRLGIVGGISILGTSGIVDPMSEKALVDTIKAVVDKQYAENQERILIAPGNYGRDFCRDYLHLDIEKSVPVSNYIGEALDYIQYKGFKKILFVGHTGKLIKIAAGIMNTHSSYADGRMEIIGVHSAMAGADRETVEKIMSCITTDEAFDVIREKPYYEEVKQSILEKVLYHLNFRLKGKAEIEVVMFTTDRTHIIQSEGAEDMMKYYRIDEEEIDER